MNSVVSETTGLNPYGLISRERAEKFDLLGQLILNQREAIIVCGSAGVGKTTFLKKLKRFRENLWIICFLQGDEDLNLFEIQKQLAVTILQRHFEILSLDIQKALAFCEQKKEKVILVIDNAVMLRPGLVENIIEYALQHPIIRPVFAFTQEQLSLKSETDKALENCYFMEIPSLTLQETGEFIQDLPEYQAAKSPNIPPKLLSKVYQRTAGVPGKIAVDFPLLMTQENNLRSLRLKIILVLGILFMATLLYVQSHGFNSHTFLKDISAAFIEKFTNLVKLFK